MASLTIRGKLAEQLYSAASSIGLTPENYILSLLQTKCTKRVEYLPLYPFENSYNATVVN